jgi:hypothetical protein
MHVLVGLLLLLAQQIAATHALSHEMEGASPDHACELCASALQFASGLTSAPPRIYGESSAPTRPEAPAARCPNQSPLAPRSRGPPAFLR